MTVPSNDFPLEGDYQLLWSQTAKFENGRTITLKEGFAARGTMTVTANFAVPEAPLGLYYVAFARPGRDEPTILSFSVTPCLKIQPALASPGASVTIYGTGFPAEDTGTINFDGTPTNLKITAGKTGSFVVDLVVPAVPASEHQLTVTSSKLSTNIDPAKVSVVPAITIDPKLPQAGAKVTINGGGFAAKSMVSIKCNDAPIANSPSTDESGNLSYSFTLSPNPEKGYKFNATDQASNIATISVGASPSPPPPSPTPSPQPHTTPEPKIPASTVSKTLSRPTALEPKGQTFGILGTEPVKFVWTQISGSNLNTVFYTLEVADNYKFSQVKPEMRASGINQNSYTMNLEPGTYYWRVKANDTTGNESDWANSLYTFSVGLLSTWLIVLGVIVFIIICYLLVRSLFRRSKTQSPYYYY
jgi:hypothetical protein